MDRSENWSLKDFVTGEKKMSRRIYEFLFFGFLAIGLTVIPAATYLFSGCEMEKAFWVLLILLFVGNVMISNADYRPLLLMSYPVFLFAFSGLVHVYSTAVFGSDMEILKYLIMALAISLLVFTGSFIKVNNKNTIDVLSVLSTVFIVAMPIIGLLSRILVADAMSKIVIYASIASVLLSGPCISLFSGRLINSLQPSFKNALKGAVFMLWFSLLIWFPLMLLNA